MLKDLRIIYMGTPDFAVAPLKALLEAGFNVVGVVTNPDKPAGRGQKVLSSPVKDFALEKGLPLLQPNKFRDPIFLEDLKKWNADLQIVVAFKMLPEVVWAMPKMGTFNLHASLLPQYRGAAPINYAIINGEKYTGITTFFLQQDIDTGNILLQKEVEIKETETAGSLHDKLMKEGAKLVIDTVSLIIEGNYTEIPQKDATNLKYAPKIFKEDCRINWQKEGRDIYNLIRGLSPYPAAWTLLEKGEKSVLIKIYECSFEETEIPLEIVGNIITEKTSSLKIAVKGGYISIKKLQQAGKRAMSIDEFLRGFQDITLYKLS